MPPSSSKGRVKRATFNTATHYVKKRVKRQSSKPLFGWLQKKLGGSGRASNPPIRGPGERPRAATLQQPEIVTLNSDGGMSPLQDDDISHIGRSTYPRSSRSSTGWSPSHAETADDDASIRPLPPTSPPSPSPSRSSSSYLSDPRTFKSVAASTKPTTLISIDLGTNGMAHIAQAPATPLSTNSPSALPRFSTSSGSVSNSTSITFSALPPASPGANSSLSPNTVQAPLHTSHHPRYNPRPSSPPLDNASVLTLASSAFAFPTGRMGNWPGDSQSQFALESGSHQGDQETEEFHAEDASVRALRPRSSRRNSWDSELSRWSARVLLGRDRSLRTNSFKVGDGDGSEAGEDCDTPDILKGTPWPSPLASDAISTDVTEPGDPGEDKQDVHVDLAQESSEAQNDDSSLSRQTTTGEPERTPTKKATLVSDNLSLDGDLTATVPLTFSKKSVETRRPSGEA